MKIEEMDGDIFASGCESLVNPVNCYGINGAGLAKAFKRWAPDAARCFEQTTRTVPIAPGDVVPILSLDAAKKVPQKRAPMIYFFPTKIRWQDPSKIEWVELGLQKLIKCVNANVETQKDVAIPALGCGLGELKWIDVRPHIIAAAKRMTCQRVVVFRPREMGR